jgi:hypothetical protein
MDRGSGRSCKTCRALRSAFTKREAVVLVVCYRGTTATFKVVSPLTSGSIAEPPPAARGSASHRVSDGQAAPSSLDYSVALLIVAPNGWKTSFVMDLVGEPPAG